MNRYWTESYRCKQSYKEGAKFCYETIPYISLRQYQSWSLAWGASTWCWFIPQDQLCAQKWPWVLALHELHRTELHHFSSQQQGKLRSLLGLLCLWHCCLTSPTTRPSCSPCRTISWTQTTIAKISRFEFSLCYQKEKRRFRSCSMVNLLSQNLLKLLWEILPLATLAKTQLRVRIEDSKVTITHKESLNEINSFAGYQFIVILACWVQLWIWCLECAIYSVCLDSVM